MDAPTAEGFDIFGCATEHGQTRLNFKSKSEDPQQQQQRKQPQQKKPPQQKRKGPSDKSVDACERRRKWREKQRRYRQQRKLESTSQVDSTSHVSLNEEISFEEEVDLCAKRMKDEHLDSYVAKRGNTIIHPKTISCRKLNEHRKNFEHTKGQAESTESAMKNKMQCLSIIAGGGYPHHGELTNSSLKPPPKHVIRHGEKTISRGHAHMLCLAHLGIKIPRLFWWDKVPPGRLSISIGAILTPLER